MTYDVHVAGILVLCPTTGYDFMSKTCVKSIYKFISYITENAVSVTEASQFREVIAV
jgi:hypothetical protein